MTTKSTNAQQVPQGDELPLVTVLMPVYNAESYLRLAIESILAQTYQNFELLIIDDGSSDRSYDIVSSFAKKDKRIRCVRQKNSGASAAKNHGIRIAKGELIAFQDADDLSLPTRLEKQVNYLLAHLDIDMLGTSFEVMDENGNTQAATHVLTHPDDLKLAIIFANQFGQGTLMIRQQVFEKAGLYKAARSGADDYELWMRIAKVSKTANLKESLYKWRMHSNNVTTRQADQQQRTVQSLTAQEFAYFLQHRQDYKMLSLHPTSTNLPPKTYLQAKSLMFCDMAGHYARNGLLGHSVSASLLALLHAPWMKQPYKSLAETLMPEEKASVANAPQA